MALFGVFAVVVVVLTWETGRLIDAMRSREHIAERLGIADDL